MQHGMDRSLCILMEFAAGGTLGDDIRRQRKTGKGYAVNVVIERITQLAMAVIYMHRRNVLHRDLSSGAHAVPIAQPTRLYSS